MKKSEEVIASIIHGLGEDVCEEVANILFSYRDGDMKPVNLKELNEKDCVVDANTCLQLIIKRKKL